MFRLKEVLTVLLFLLLIPLAFAQSSTGSVGLNVITGELIDTEIKEQNVEILGSDNVPEEVNIRKESKGLAAFTGNAINDESMGNCLKVLLPVLVVIIVIVVIGYFLCKKKHGHP